MSGDIGETHNTLMESNQKQSWLENVTSSSSIAAQDLLQLSDEVKKFLSGIVAYRVSILGNIFLIVKHNGKNYYKPISGNGKAVDAMGVFSCFSTLEKEKKYFPISDLESGLNREDWEKSKEYLLKYTQVKVMPEEVLDK